MRLLGSEPKPIDPEKVFERDDALRQQYDEMPASYPETSLDANGPTLTEDVAFRKRLIYRSKQRGWCV